MRINVARHQRGDTIVEVMIALAILGAVMVAGYAISTRSLGSVRAAQERSEALKIAESQLELLRNHIYGLPNSAPNNEVKITTETAYCFDGANIKKYTLASNDPTKLSEYSIPEAQACIKSNRYHVAVIPEIIPDPAPADGLGGDELRFNVNVYWERISGGELQQVTLAYKVPATP